MSLPVSTPPPFCSTTITAHVISRFTLRHNGKGEDSPRKHATSSPAMFSRLPSSSLYAFRDIDGAVVFTDGSYDPTTGKAGYAVVCGAHPELTFRSRVCGPQTNVLAELQAIEYATHRVASDQHLTIVTDSAISIDELRTDRSRLPTSKRSKHSHLPTILNIQNSINRRLAKGLTTRIVHIYSHTEAKAAQSEEWKNKIAARRAELGEHKYAYYTSGNEMADTAARQSLTLPDLPPVIFSACSDSFALVKDKQHPVPGTITPILRSICHTRWLQEFRKKPTFTELFPDTAPAAATAEIHWPTSNAIFVSPGRAFGLQAYTSRARSDRLPTNQNMHKDHCSLLTIDLASTPANAVTVVVPKPPPKPRKRKIDHELLQGMQPTPRQSTLLLPSAPAPQLPAKPAKRPLRVPVEAVRHAQTHLQSPSCRRCKQSQSVTDTRTHLLVECPTNEPLVQLFLSQLLPWINKHLRVNINIIPNWFTVFDSPHLSRIASATTPLRPLAGMLGFMPLYIYAWFHKLSFQPTVSPQTFANQLNMRILDLGRTIVKSKLAQDPKPAIPLPTNMVVNPSSIPRSSPVFGKARRFTRKRQRKS